MRTEILKLNGIFNMSFGKTFFTVESEYINKFINGKSKRTTGTFKYIIPINNIQTTSQIDFTVLKNIIFPNLKVFIK